MATLVVKPDLMAASHGSAQTRLTRSKRQLSRHLGQDKRHTIPEGPYPYGPVWRPRFRFAAPIVIQFGSSEHTRAVGRRALRLDSYLGEPNLSETHHHIRNPEGPRPRGPYRIAYR